MSEGETPTPAVSLGTRLAAAREAAGLSLSEAAERLHLDAATVSALEHEHYQTLGAAVYVRGHLRRYAELLGLPAAEVDAAYRLTASAVSGMPDLRRVATPLEAAAGHSWALRPGPAAAVAGLLALSALVWWAMRMPHASHGAAPVNAVPAASESGGSGATGLQPPGGSIPRPAPTGLPTSSGSGGAPAGSNAAPQEGPVAPRVEAAPKRPVVALQASPTAPVGAAPPGSVRLGLQFRENSWVEIYDSGGARLMYELAAAGSEHAMRGSAPLHILLGNPSGVDLSVDGRPVTFSEPPRGDSPLRLSLDGSGRVLEVRAAVTAGAAASASGAHP
jgi:cytoskeleton protein RodZ